jgi:hypothetical protein
MTEYRKWSDMWADHDTDVEIMWSSDGGGWEWEELALVRRPHGDTYQYAAYIDSGCSCNYPYEFGPDAYELEWSFDKNAPKAKLQVAIRGSYYLDSGEKVRYLSSLQNT